LNIIANRKQPGVNGARPKPASENRIAACFSLAVPPSIMLRADEVIDE
jgi:hypothetical protein